MTDFILLLIMGVFWTWGVHCLFAPKYILYKIGEVIWESVPKWLTKPLFVCPPCMASVHGFLIATAYYDFHLMIIIVYMVCLCGVNFILKELIYADDTETE